MCPGCLFRYKDDKLGDHHYIESYDFDKRCTQVGLSDASELAPVVACLSRSVRRSLLRAITCVQHAIPKGPRLGNLDDPPVGAEYGFRGVKRTIHKVFNG